MSDLKETNSILNPYIDRWELDDQDWVRERKRNWIYIESNLQHFGETNKQIKALKSYYLYGTEPSQEVRLSCANRLAYTPCNNEKEVVDIFENELSNCYSAYDATTCCFSMRALGSFGKGTSENNPFGFAGEQALLIARAFFIDSYHEVNGKARNGELYPKYESAIDFVNEYIKNAYVYLTDRNEFYYHPLPHVLDYFISCLWYVEENDQIESIHPWLPNLISVVYNFVEPRGQYETNSDVANFAQEFVDRLERGDAPNILKNVVSKLGPYKLFEASVEAPPKEYLLCGGKPLYKDKEWDAPVYRVMHGADIPTALHVMLTSARRIGLLTQDYVLPEVRKVNLASLLSEPFVCELGFELTSIPAYRYTVWFTPQQIISNKSDAGFGMDIMIPIYPKDTEIKSDTPVLLYIPRLSEHYKKWYVTEQLILLERMWRWEISHYENMYLYDYDDETPTPGWAAPPDDIAGYSYFQAGYYPLDDEEIGLSELAISGPSVAPWEGETLPPAPRESASQLPPRMDSSNQFIRKRTIGGGGDGYMDLAVIVKCGKGINIKSVQQLLDMETRPEFDDELKEGQKVLFNVIDELPFPIAMKLLDDNRLYIEWKNIELRQQQDLDENLQSVGIKIEKALMFNPEMELEPGKEDIYFKRNKKGELVTVNTKRKKLKQSDEFQGDGEKSAKYQALMQNY